MMMNENRLAKMCLAALMLMAILPLQAQTSVANVAAQAAALPDYTVDYFSHETPYIPPQCYTQSLTLKSVQTPGDVANPCYVCHTQGKRPNVLNDSETQLNFTFLGAAQTNPWRNLFVDRRAQIAAINDADILRYVQQDNYRTAEGDIAINQRIENNLAAFDVNQNGKWDGYLPDAFFQFDDKGFDRNSEGGYSGWRSFAYYPFPGTFMPTNGSTDDVLIRLPSAFQTDEQGRWSVAIYELNLAIVEALIKEKNIPIAATDENTLGVDLNKNGKLDTAREIVYEWAPLQKKYMSYVGAAKTLLATKQIHLAAKLYPEGTEFLHTVRYLDVSPEGKVGMAKRMKELRYARKKYWVTYFGHETIAGAEIKERHDFPDRPKTIVGSAEAGIEVAQGWVYQGFIEDAKGELRPQTYEEHGFCAGCHSGAGTLIDSSYAFYRKFPSQQFQQGWYHWTQKALEAIADPKRESDGEYEYSFYLKHNPTGDEYASNTEVFNKFYNADGKPKVAAFATLHGDIGYLLTPSPARALALNKAYKLVVEEQSFNQGRDAVLAPLQNVHKYVEQDQATGILEELNFF
jgi:hypothetical protein